MKQIKIIDENYFYPMQIGMGDYNFIYFDDDGKSPGNFLVYNHNKSKKKCKIVYFTRFFTLNGTPQYDGESGVEWVL